MLEVLRQVILQLRSAANAQSCFVFKREVGAVLWFLVRSACCTLVCMKTAVPKCIVEADILNSLECIY